MEICTIRGSPALWIFPKVDELATLAPGALKCGLFRTSKKSPRNWVETRSVMRKVFASDQSRLQKPGERIRLRGLLPKVPGAASAKAEALNHELKSWARGRSDER